MVANPPGGVRWGFFAEESATLAQKASYLFSAYALPGFLACFAIVMFQMQGRVASTGANKRTVFSLCVLASGAMLTAFRLIAYTPTSASSYVTGMALGYTLMSRLYAVRMRLFFGRMRLPWPVWRGNIAGVRQIDEMARMQRGAAPIGQ